MTKKQWLYLVLTGLGAVLPWYFNWQFMQQSEGAGFDVAGFIAGGLANPAAGSLAMDITIAAITGFTWMIVEARRLGMKHAWAYIVIGCSVAFACALPLFLFMRERHLQKQKDGAENQIAEPV